MMQTAFRTRPALYRHSTAAGWTYRTEMPSSFFDKPDLFVDGKLKRAGVLYFYRSTEKIINGCYVKIGKFEGSEPLYQD